MTLALERTAADEKQGAEALFKEARQRRHRRWAIGTAIAAAVVVAGVAVAFGPRLVGGPTAGPHPSGVSPPAIAASRIGATIVYAYKNLRIVDANSGATRTLPLPTQAGGSSDLSMLIAGRSLVLNRGDTAWLYQPSLRGAPIDLGPSLRVIPGPVDGEVWIWSDPCAKEPACTNAANEPFNGTVRLVDDSGHQIAPPAPLPINANWFPTGQSLSAGLVLAVAYGPGSDRTEIWDPKSNDVVRVLASYPFAAHGDWIATEAGSACPPRCSIRVTSLQSGKTQSISLPPGVDASGPGAVSPDGATLALLGTLYGHPTHWPGAVIVVSLRSGTARVLPATDVALHSAYGPPPISWSSNGWLFATRIGGSAVLAWHPGARGMAVLPRVRLPNPRLAPPRAQTEDPTMVAF